MYKGTINYKQKDFFALEYLGIDTVLDHAYMETIQSIIYIMLFEKYFWP